MEIVSALRSALGARVGQERLELWFGPATRMTLAEGKLRVTAPSRFFVDFLRANFRGHLEAVCKDVLGHWAELEFCVDAAAPDSGGADDASGRRPRGERPADEVNGQGNGPMPPPSTKPFGSLESFVVGPSNRLAYASAEMTARQPGQITPLVIHGPTGVGKTHLLQGIWTSLRKARRTGRVIYLSAEQFTSSFLEALRGSGLPSFRRKYRGVEVFLLDDLHFIAGKRATQVELMNTVDELLREGRQLVFASDRPPAELTELGPEMIGRLNSGMVCPVEPPDCQTRRGIVTQMARRMGLVVPEEVQEFVAARLVSHARELSGALCRLQASSQAFGCPVTLTLAEEALSDMIRCSAPVVRLGDIEKAICDLFGVSANELQSVCKSKVFSHPRMLAMWLARKHTRAALSEIGDFFGRRSHSTVLSAQKRIERWMVSGKRIELANRAWNVGEAIQHIEKRLRAC